MKFPEEVLCVCRAASERHPEDVSAAVDEAVARLKRLASYPDLVETLVRQAVQDLVYEARHVKNVRTRRENGGYGGPPKVTVGGNAEIGRVYEDVFAYRIAGTTLGSLTGAELPAVASKEREIAGGHLFNAALCERLARSVPVERTVREVVSEKRLRALFRELRRPAGAAT